MNDLNNEDLVELSYLLKLKLLLLLLMLLLLLLLLFSRREMHENLKITRRAIVPIRHLSVFVVVAVEVYFPRELRNGANGTTITHTAQTQSRQNCYFS